MGMMMVIFFGKSRFITTGTITLSAAIAMPVTIVPKYKSGQPLKTRMPDARVRIARKKKITTSGERVRATGLIPSGAAAPKQSRGIAVRSEIAPRESPRSERMDWICGGRLVSAGRRLAATAIRAKSCTARER